MGLDTREDKQYLEHLEQTKEVRACIAGRNEVLKLVSCFPGPRYSRIDFHDGMTEDQRRHAIKCNKLADEQTQAYWARGRFCNFTGQTTNSLDGMIHSKPPVTDERPPQLDYLTENTDGDNNGLNQFAKKITSEMVAVSRQGVLVDMPYSETRPTQSQQESGELAPRWIHYKSEQILPAPTGEVRLLEYHEEKKKEFDFEVVIRIRRLVMIDGVYHNQLFNDKEEMLSDVVPVANGRPWNEIPFQYFGSSDNTAAYSKIEMYDLAHVNLGHFTLDCDNRWNLHNHCCAATFLSCLLYTSPSPRDVEESRMPSSA